MKKTMSVSMLTLSVDVVDVLAIEKTYIDHVKVISMIAYSD